MHDHTPLPTVPRDAKPARSKPLITGVVLQTIAAAVMVNGFKGLDHMSFAEWLRSQVGGAQSEHTNSHGHSLTDKLDCPMFMASRSIRSLCILDELGAILGGSHYALRGSQRYATRSQSITIGKACIIINRFTVRSDYQCNLRECSYLIYPINEIRRYSVS